MAVFYVRSSGGSDANDGLSFANAKATLSGAFSAMSNSDELRVCADGTHLPTAENTCGTLTGILIVGANGTTGADDGTVATISGASLPSTTDIFRFNTTGGERATFKNIRLTASKRNGIYIVGSMTIRMRNCRVDTCASNGVAGSASGSILIARYCSFDTNTLAGMGADGTATSARLQPYLFACAMHHNGTSGVHTTSGGRFAYCLFYRNGSDGYRQSSTGLSPDFVNCTFAFNTGSGIRFTASSGVISGYNNIFANNGAYGINHNGASRVDATVWGSNAYYSNTIDSVDINSGNISVTEFDSLDDADPGFVSTTDGSEDFGVTGVGVVGLGKPGAMPYGGTGYATPGALQPQSSGGGGLRRVFGGGMI